MATINITTDQNFTAIGAGVDDTITISQGAKLTLNTDTLVRIDIFQCTTFGKFLVTNASTTVPIFCLTGDDSGSARLRFEGGGEFEVRGAWITIGTSDGTANQTFTLPTNAGGDSYVELAGLETGLVSDPMVWNRVPAFTDTFGDEKFGAVYTHTVGTDTITFGDGTNGYIPSNGEIIRVPNIQFQDESTGVAFTDFDMASAGTIDFEICSFGPNFAPNFKGSSTIIIDSVSFDDPYAESFSISNTTGAILKKFVFYTTYKNTAFSGTDSNDVTIENSRIYHDNSNDLIALSLTSGAGGVLNDVVCVSTGDDSATSRGSFFCTSAGVKFTDCYSAGSIVGFYLSGGGGAILTRCRSNGIGKRGGTGYSPNGILLLNSPNNTIIDYGQHPDTVAEGLAPFNSYIINNNTGSSGTTVDGLVVYCGNSGEPNRSNGIISSNGINSRFNNIVSSGSTSNDTVNFGVGSTNVEVSNLVLNDAQTGAGGIEWSNGVRFALVSSANGNIDGNCASPALNVGSLNIRNKESTTEGKLVRMMTDYKTNIVTQTGVIAFDKRSSLYMGTTGDVIEFETEVHYGITDFTSFTVTGSNGLGGWDYEFKMRNPDGTYGAYQELTFALMSSTLATLTDYDSTVGLQITIKAERTATNLTNYIQQIRMGTTLDVSAQAPFELYPTSMEITGLSSGDAVIVTDASNVQKKYEVSDGSDFTLGLPNANAGETWTFVIKRIGYTMQRGTFTIEAGTDVAVTAVFSPKQQAVGGSMYTGSDVASVSIDYDLVTPQMSVDISVSGTSPQNVFDKVERSYVTNNGMKWLAQQGTDTQYQNLGGAGAFLFHQGAIRVRRRLVGDTNAEILAFVFSTDGIAVDESNGPVTLFSGTLVKDVWEAIVDDYDDVDGSFGKAVSQTLKAAKLAASLSA